MMHANQLGQIIKSTFADRAMIQRFFSFLILTAGNKGLGLIQAMLIIRMMEKNDYALYSVVTSCAMAMISLANGGIGMFISSSGGRYFHDPQRLGSVRQAGQWLQNRLGLIASLVLVVALPIQCLNLNMGDQPWHIALASLLGITLLATILYSIINSEILAITLHVATNQIFDLALTSVRLFAYVFLWWFGLLDALSGLAVMVISGFAQVVILEQRIRRLGLIAPGPLRPEDRKEAWRVVGPNVPFAAWNSTQDLLPWGLLAWFGSSLVVADFAALSRLALIIAYISDVLKGWFLPRIGRCQDPERLMRLIASVLLGFWLATWTALIVAYIFRAELIWLLGEKYLHVEADLPLLLVYQGILAVGGGLFLVNSSRAWVIHPWWFIITNIVSQAVGIWLLDLSSVRGMIWFQILPALPFIFVNIYFLGRGWTQERTCSQI